MKSSITLPVKPKTKHSNHTQRLASNVLYQFGSQSLVLTLTFVFSPYVVHRLGVDLYGLLILAGLTTNYFAIVELGLGQATVKFLADAYARRDANRLRLILWTSVLTYLALSIVAALGLAALAPWLTHLLRVPRASTILTEQIFYLCALGLAVSMMGSIFASVPRALERFDIVTFLGIPAGIGQLALNLLLLYLGYSIRALVIGGVVIQSFVLAAYIGVAYRLLRPLGRPTWDRLTLRQLLGFGSLISISQVVRTHPCACGEIYHRQRLDAERGGVLQRPLQSGMGAHIYSRQYFGRAVPGLLAPDCRRRSWPQVASSAARHKICVHRHPACGRGFGGLQP